MFVWLLLANVCIPSCLWHLPLHGSLPGARLRLSVSWCRLRLVSWNVGWNFTNLVDPASSHMLVSKIKPCMSQYKLLHGETANGSLKQLSFIWC